MTPSLLTIFKIITVASLPLLVAWSLLTDLRERKIYNSASLLLLFFFLVSALLYQFSPSEILWHLAAGAVGFLVLFPLFLTGQMGGGDIKLVAILLVWYGWEERAIQLIFWITLCGGVLALGTMPVAIYLKRNDPQKIRWRDRYKDIKFPYALAIASGVLITFSKGWWMTRGMS